MCQISFSVNATDSDGSIVSGEGRYKLSSTSTWSSPFSIPNINSASTPDINADGDYDLEIRVLDNSSGYSSWTSVAGFSVGNCNPMSFSNALLSMNYTKNDCPSNQTGSSVTYTVAANTYQSNISQADADQQATNDQQANGQTFANTNGTCTANSNLVINSSIPTIQGLGTIDITGGEPLEVINLSFGLLFYNGTGNQLNKSIDFNTVSGVTLDVNNQSDTTSVTLDNLGNYSTDYVITEGELSCNVSMTNRSAALAIPLPTNTLIDMPNLVAI